MSRAVVITGTDTDVGKTVFAAALAGALDGCYWKPIQAGLEGGGDRAEVGRLSGLAADRLLAEHYRLSMPASPHLAAERDGIAINTDALNPPACDRPLVVEAAGGLLVPLTRRVLQADVIARWGLPVVLCASTRLGTINHSLLSIEALGQRSIPILGVAFIGDSNEDSERTICDIGKVRRLGRLAWIAPLDAARLKAAFAASFRIEDFR